MLARSGIAKLTLIDFDQVTLSSTNRHATATLRDVGISKVQAIANFLGDACPNCEVIIKNEMFNEKSASLLLDECQHDFIVDAIDDITTKAYLVKSCIDRNIRCISSMGAACKADPTRLHIGSLKSATKDPLCTKLRWALKKLSVDVNSETLQIIYSSEKVVTKLAELTAEQAAAPTEFGNVDHMRLRVLPVLGTMPAIMGQAIASFVLCEVAGKSFTPTAGERLGKAVSFSSFWGIVLFEM